MLFLWKCKFITFKAVHDGFAVISVTNSSNGETRYVPINVYKDQFSIYRIDNLDQMGSGHDSYNGYTRGVYITDISYSRQGAGFNVSMNIYNHN